MRHWGTTTTHSHVHAHMCRCQYVARAHLIHVEGTLCYEHLLLFEAIDRPCPRHTPADQDPEDAGQHEASSGAANDQPPTSEDPHRLDATLKSPHPGALHTRGDHGSRQFVSGPRSNLGSGWGGGRSLAERLRAQTQLRRASNHRRFPSGASSSSPLSQHGVKPQVQVTCEPSTTVE